MHRLGSQIDLDANSDFIFSQQLFNIIELQFFLKIRGEPTAKTWVTNLVPYRGWGSDLNVCVIQDRLEHVVATDGPQITVGYNIDLFLRLPICYGL